jgi:hypothetical protein
MPSRFARATLAVAAVAIVVIASPSLAANGVFVRFKLLQPQGTSYYVRLGGYIHKSPWYLPKTVVPDGADKEPTKRVAAGEWTPWFDLARHAGSLLHGRMSRSGGVAEWPNITADFITSNEDDRRSVVIELATAADQANVVKRFEESFRGQQTSFLVSPRLAEDADDLETASQMTARRLGWAREASGGRAVSPEQLILQTSFWSPQRDELNLQEAEVLRLLGFNVVGNQPEAVRERFAFCVPGHTHDVDFGPAVTRDGTEEQIAKQVPRLGKLAPGVPMGFSDEITCPELGTSEQARKHFQQWLARRQISPADLGVKGLEDVVPIANLDELRKREQQNRAIANRVFYYTSRFRQEATTERLRWLTESVHRHLSDGPLTTTLVADHPYFSGTGLGMGTGPNPAWGRVVLAADWFDLARRKAVDLAGIEDWMGLQYMYGPGTTWEGFQLMGFQAAIFRSGGRGSVPVIAWITPSDETNLRLKSASAICQGVKHFFYWTYGPTCTSTENYWSDLRGAYDGIVHIARQLAAAEPILAPGKTRPTRLALLYSISSDLWQPFGYIPMLERRGTYLSLVHDQYLVDMLTEEDVDAGRLTDYDVLYATDPCVKASAAAKIAAWVRGGGHFYGSCAAGSRNEFNEPVPGLAEVFGIEPKIETQVQSGAYHVRGALNGIEYLDRVSLGGSKAEGVAAPSGPAAFGVLGVKARFTPTGAEVLGTFADGAPAVVRHAFGKGEAVYVGACPALAYLKDAKFVPAELKERWPTEHRRFINATAARRGVPRLVELSHPVVEAGVFDSDRGTVLVLANFTYEPIEKLEVRLPVARPVKSVRSVEQGDLAFTVEPAANRPASRPECVKFSLALGLNDMVIVEH